MLATLLTAGLACVIAGIIGGGLKAWGVEIPSLASTRRQIVLVFFGLLLLFSASFPWLSSRVAALHMNAVDKNGSIDPPKDKPIQVSAVPTVSPLIPRGKQDRASTDLQAIAGRQQQDKEDVASVVNAWRLAQLGNDPKSISNFYADQVNRYFQKEDTTRSYVLALLEARRNSGGLFKKVDLSNVQISFRSDNTATADFDETLEIILNGNITNNQVHTVLHLVKDIGTWKINFERQPTVYSSSITRATAG